MQSVAWRESLPSERHDEDLYLVEFPKSGVTWLTFLIANVNVLLNGDRRVVTFFNINDFVPDVQVTRYASLPHSPLPGYRCFKSHAPRLQQYRKVFYLVRDPRHIMVSYWVFLNSIGWWRGTLEQLISHPEFGIAAWVDHVTGWLDGSDATVSFALIRYEDLMADTHGELKRLYGLLGMPVTDALLQDAVERSSIERMRELEAEFNARHPALKNFAFVRRDPPGGARGPLPDHLRDVIERRAGPLMERLGYRLTGNAAEQSPGTLIRD